MQPSEGKHRREPTLADERQADMRPADYAKASARVCDRRAEETAISESVSSEWKRLGSAWRQIADEHERLEDGHATAAPSIVPAISEPSYVVMDDFERLGVVYREVDAKSDEAMLIEQLVGGQYNRPQKIIAFNADEGWSRDVSEEIANKALKIIERDQRSVSPSTKQFIERHLGFEIPSVLV